MDPDPGKARAEAVLFQRARLARRALHAGDVLRGCRLLAELAHELRRPSSGLGLTLPTPEVAHVGAVFRRDECGSRGPARREIDEDSPQSGLPPLVWNAPAYLATKRRKRPAVGFAQGLLNSFARHVRQNGLMRNCTGDPKVVAAELARVPVALTVDCIFGPVTEHAVRAFQACQGLTVDGKVGPVTWRALEREASLSGAAAVVGALPEARRCPPCELNPHRPPKGIKGPAWATPHLSRGLAGQVFFATASAQLDYRDFDTLDDLIAAYDRVLPAHAAKGRNFTFQYVGFADPRRYVDNLALSRDRACAVATYVDARLCRHSNYVRKLRARGVDTAAAGFPRTEEALAGFRRVDILAPRAVLPKEERPSPQPPIDGFFADRFTARIRDMEVLTGGPVAFVSATVDVVAINAKEPVSGNVSCLQMVFHLFGDGLKPPGKVGVTTLANTCFQDFKTSRPIRIREVQGFMNLVLSPGKIVLTALGPMHEGGARPVTIGWQVTRNFSPTVFIGGLHPNGAPRHVRGKTLRALCKGDEALRC